MHKLTLILLLIITNVQSIGQYDFNACRIANCNAQELNCISQEQGCLNTFSAMRSCFAGCTGMQSNFNPCWVNCKNAAARADSNWLSLSLCYQNVCYLSSSWITTTILLILALYLL